MDDVLFIAGKSLHVLAEPDSVVLLLLALGTLLLWRGSGRTGRRLVVFSTVVLIALSTLPIGALLLRTLEDRFPRPNLATLPPPDGIVVLGGALHAEVGAARRTLALNAHAERIVEMVILARRFPDARIIHTGGRADIFQTDATEADLLAPYLELLGLAPGRVELEGRARNTYENATESLALARPRPGQRWLLVTTAAHMPRAVGAFRAVGWKILPFPVDYRTSGRDVRLRFDPAARWRQLRFAMHETVGQAIYYVTGRSSSPFPGPETR